MRLEGKKKIKIYSSLHLPTRSLLQVLEKVRIKKPPDVATDAIAVSAQSLTSGSLEAGIVAIHLRLYTGVSKTLTAVLVCLGSYPVSMSFQLSLSNDTLYNLTVLKLSELK